MSHYGNGDGLGLEPVGDDCRVWWAGHDPWFLVYWAPSLEGFLELWLERARAPEARPAGGSEGWAPTREASPAARDDARDPELASLFDALPRGTIVHDLRRAPAGTEIPFERLARLAHRGALVRRGLLLAFAPPPKPVAVEPMPIAAYDAEELDAEARALLRALPKGSLVVHERNLPPGGRIDDAAYPSRDVAWRPPFHVVYPKRPWWRFW